MADLITPHEHFEGEVLPNYRDYMDDLTSERRAKNVANSVCHFPEWAFHYFKEHDRKRLRGTNSVKHLTARLCEECRELDLVVQFANAGKHRFLTPAQNYMIPTSTSAVIDAGGRLKIIATGEFFDQVLTGAIVFLRGWIG